MALLIGYLFNKADDTERGVQDKVGAMYFIITTQVCFGVGVWFRFGWADVARARCAS